MGRQPLENGFPTGPRLKSLRQGLGLSQRELARRAGITNANLSMIEQDKVSPSLFTLERILDAMAIDLAGFFASVDDPLPVRKEGEFEVVRRKGGEFRIMPTYESSVSRCHLARVILYAHGDINSLWLKGWGQVSGLLVEGTASFTLDGVVYTLQAGDGFEFVLNRKYSFRNESADIATMVLTVETKL